MTLEEFSANLKKLRQQKNVTRKQLADALGINETSFGKYERGEVSPPIDKVLKMADLLKLSVIDLIGDTQYSPAKIDADNKILEYRYKRALYLATIGGLELKEKDGEIIIQFGKVKIVDNKPVAYFYVNSEEKKKFIEIIEITEVQALKNGVRLDKVLLDYFFPPKKK